MNVVDIVILVILVSFAIIGFKRGFLYSLVSFLGSIGIIYAAYLLKNYLGDVFVTDLPFFSIKIGTFSSQVMNVIMYQTVAFIIMTILFGLVYKAIIILTGIVEKILKLTIVLGIPSKILGLIFGILEGYIIVYLVLFIVTQPYVKMDILNNSSYAKTILTKTPVLSGFANNTVEVVNEINDIVEDKDTKDFDLKLSELILKHKVTSPDVMQELVDKKKITVDGINEIIQKYKEEDITIDEEMNS